MEARPTRRGLLPVRLDRLKSLATNGIAFDTETWLITPGNLAPRMVCGSIGWLEVGPTFKGAILDRDQCLDTFAQIVEDHDTVLLVANGPFDFLVMATEFAKLGLDIMPQIFAMFEGHRVYDILIAAQLDAIANGHLGFDPRTGGTLKNPETGKQAGYGLAVVIDLHLGRTDAKANDEWRLRYSELDGIPIPQWPPAAIDYPIDDVKNTDEGGLAQTGHVPRVSHDHEWGDMMTPEGKKTTYCVRCGSTRMSAQCIAIRPLDNLLEVANQSYSAWCLYLGDAWGLRVDQSKVDIIEAHSRKKRAANIGPFLEAGIIRPEGSEDRSVLKRKVAIAYGAADACPQCAGTGKVPSAKQAELRCPDCKGRCQPYKAGGKIKAPDVASCATCHTTGKVPHHNIKMVNCIGPSDEKTCDGTGLFLTPDVPRSDADGIAFGRDTCFESGDELLMAFGAFKEDEKILKDYVPYLRKARVCVACGKVGDEDSPHVEGCTAPGWQDINLTLRSNAVLETGRVSYKGYIQLFPRAPGYLVDNGDGTYTYIPSLRECIVARAPTHEVVEVPADYTLQPGESFVGGAS